MQEFVSGWAAIERQHSLQLKQHLVQYRRKYDEKFVVFASQAPQLMKVSEPEKRARRGKWGLPG